MKKKILWVSEASFMNTGFSVQAMECLQRLHATGKYELAELGSYVNDNDPRGLDLPWQFYGAIPTQEGTLAHKIFYFLFWNFCVSIRLKCACNDSTRLTSEIRNGHFIDWSLYCHKSHHKFYGKFSFWQNGRYNIAGYCNLY